MSEIVSLAEYRKKHGNAKRLNRAFTEFSDSKLGSSWLPKKGWNSWRPNNQQPAVDYHNSYYALRSTVKEFLILEAQAEREPTVNNVHMLCNVRLQLEAILSERP